MYVCIRRRHVPAAAPARKRRHSSSSRCQNVLLYVPTLYLYLYVYRSKCRVNPSTTTRVNHTVAILLQYYCALFDPFPTPFMPYTIQYRAWQYRVQGEPRVIIQSRSAGTASTHRVNPNPQARGSGAGLSALQISTYIHIDRYIGIGIV